MLISYVGIHRLAIYWGTSQREEAGRNVILALDEHCADQRPSQSRPALLEYYPRMLSYA